VAPGADESASVEATGGTDFSSPSRIPFENDTPAYATLERNRWLLDGTFDLLPAPVAYWSEELSGAYCTFVHSPTLTFSFGNQYSSLGITLLFDTATGEYCRRVSVKWYQGDVLKSEKDFFPDGTTYFCENKVSSYDKVVVTLLQTSLPHRRARLNQIVFGLTRIFYMDQLDSVHLVNEMDLAALSVPVSSMSWVLNSEQDVDFMFQLKQPVECWQNDRLVGVYYVDSYVRNAASLYSIDCYDAIGVLGESSFAGGVYSDRSAKDLMLDIVGGDFALDMDAVADTMLTGIIRQCSKREAIQQVIFAWGVCASTDGGSGIRLFAPGKLPKEIGDDRTYTGVSVETAAIVTEVRVEAHTYAAASSGSLEINGKKYSDTVTVYAVKNPDVTANDKANVVEITGATLVSPAIGQSVAQRVYDYYRRRSTNKSTFVWDGEALGDCVTQPTPWGTTRTGTLAKMTIELSNTVAVSGEAVEAIT
jgi:hypothetical protein